MAEVDLGKVRMTDAELSEKIIQTNGGVRFGKDAAGKPGYVVADAETGADTVIPFSKGGGGGLPSGTISFGGSVIHAVGGGANYFFHDFFEPIELSKITKIKTLSTIKNWSRLSSYSTNGLTRRLYISIHLVRNDGVNVEISTDTIAESNLTTTISVENKENVIDLERYKESYMGLSGVGIRIYQYPGGTASTYYFRSQIGNDAYPYDSCVKYEVVN